MLYALAVMVLGFLVLRFVLTVVINAIAVATVYNLEVMRAKAKAEKDKK